MNRWSLRRSACSSRFSSLFRFSLSPRLGVLVVHRRGQGFPPRTIRDHCPPIGSLGVCFHLDHDRLSCRPSAGLIVDRQEESLRLFGLLKVLNRLLEQVIAESRSREFIPIPKV